MACGLKKCKTPSCEVKMKACKMKNGYCPTCVANQIKKP